jgi:cytochrome c peroxidase
MAQYRASIKGALVAGVLAGCSSGGVESLSAEPLGASDEALTGPAYIGKLLFDHPLPGTNGRSCATCHVELGGLPNTSGLTFPHYRLRFYTDASRSQKLVDLPPPLVDPVTGQPLLGPNNFPQAFTVDPGRSIITGDPADYEAFDVPTLHGIANTAPYFHDNSRLDLESVVNLYSRAILPFIPSIGLPGVVPPAGPGLPPESLTATQKAQLIAYLKKI